MNRLVSVIVLNYNGRHNLGEELLHDCLSSVLESDYDNFEVILVDNGSTDGSIEFIKKKFGSDTRLKIIANKENYGFAVGNNRAIEHTSGDFIIFLNNDVEVDSQWIRELTRAMEEDNEIGIAQSKILNFDRTHIQTVGNLFDPILAVYLIGESQSDKGQFNKMCEISFACGAAMITRRSLIRKIGLFDPYYFWYHDDSDFSWRAKLTGFNVVSCPSSIVYHKGAATSGRTFRGSQDVFFYLTSRVGLFLKNLEMITIFRFAGRFLLSLWVDTLNLLAQGDPRTATKFILWILRSFRHNWKARTLVQHQIRKISDHEILKTFLDYSIFNFRMKRSFQTFYRFRPNNDFVKITRKTTSSYYQNHLYQPHSQDSQRARGQ